MNEKVTIDTPIPVWEVFDAVPGQLIGVTMNLDLPEGPLTLDCYSGTGRETLEIWGYEESALVSIAPILNA